MSWISSNLKWSQLWFKWFAYLCCNDSINRNKNPHLWFIESYIFLCFSLYMRHARYSRRVLCSVRYVSKKEKKAKERSTIFETWNPFGLLAQSAVVYSPLRNFFHIYTIYLSYHTVGLILQVYSISESSAYDFAAWQNRISENLNMQTDKRIFCCIYSFLHSNRAPIKQHTAQHTAF